MSKKVVQFKLPVPLRPDHPIDACADLPQSWVDAGRTRPEPASTAPLATPLEAAEPVDSCNDVRHGVVLRFSSAQRSDEASFEDRQRTARKCFRTVASMAESHLVLMFGAQDIAREWMNFTGERVQRNVDMVEQMLACRTVSALAAVHTRFVRDSVIDGLGCCSRIGQVAVNVTMEAADVMTRE